MNAYFRKSFKISVMVHSFLLALLVLLPVLTNCRKKEKPREIVMYVDLQAMLPPEPEVQVQPDPPPQQPPPDHTRIREPAVRPTPRPTARPTAKPTARPKPTRTPAPRPTIQISRERVRRDHPDPAPTRPPPSTPSLSADQIRQRLAEGLQSTTGGTPPPAGDVPGWYYSLVQQTMHERWQQPSGLAAAHGRVARVSIRVARNGQILERKLDSSSGVPALDASVMSAVNGVSQLDPLPASFTGPHKDITIDFELTGR